ncbi:hypothetical protein [Streptomyces kaniharaensis]|uniref:hypothetical protein n=1 Tax=Streptomyces kaniharaensis TaxID=212423 RepID=UPI001296E7B1|nr:hypothetical protein [Streptomyces kaniharaensis]
MTEKFPRRIGGDGDGPAETPTERLLREAMNARTSLITAHDLRPAAPPNRRIRRLRPVYAVTVPLLGLAAAMAIGVVTLHGSPVADHEVPPAATVTASPSPTPTATPTETPTPTATPTDTATPSSTSETVAPLGDDMPSADPTPSSTGIPLGSARPYTFRGVKLKIPAGWRVADPVGFHLCVLSPGAPQDAGYSDCQPYGVELSVFDTEPQNWPSTADLDAEGGWAHQPYCPVWGNPHAPAGESINSVGPTKSTPTVAGRSALKSQWKVTCGKDAFTAQMWALPKDQVFVSAIGLKDDYQPGLMSIVNSLDVSGRPALAASSTPSGFPSAPPGVSVTFSQIGSQVKVKGAPAIFSVIYQNTGQTNYAAVEPLVFTETYAGTPSSPVPMNLGKLERQDGDTWVQLPVSPGGGMDYAMAPRTASFPLAPGQSRTVTYRLTLDGDDGPGAMPVTAQAVLPYDGTQRLTVLGTRSVAVEVVK